MQNYRIIRTPLFIEQFDRQSTINQERIRKLVTQLHEKGQQVGKPLGVLWFREKKYNGNRMYFLAYEEWSAILLVAISDKKEQPLTIIKIREQLPIYKEFAFDSLKEEGLI